MNFSGQNINRVNAVKQLQKAINSSYDLDLTDLDDKEILIRFLRIWGSVANSFIYIGDCLNDLNKTLKEEGILDREAA